MLGRHRRLFSECCVGDDCGFPLSGVKFLLPSGVLQTELADVGLQCNMNSAMIGPAISDSELAALSSHRSRCNFQPPCQPLITVRVSLAATRAYPCYRRKVKCDGQRPCSTCVKHSRQMDCQTARPAVVRLTAAGHEAIMSRLRRCEELLAANGTPVDD